MKREKNHFECLPDMPGLFSMFTRLFEKVNSLSKWKQLGFSHNLTEKRSIFNLGA